MVIDWMMKFKSSYVWNIRMNEPIAYLGDGIYAEFDGYGIWLRSGDHRDELCDNKIYLEPDILASLNVNK